MDENQNDAGAPFERHDAGRLRHRRRPARRKRSLRARLIFAALIAVPALCLLTCVWLGVLLMVNQEAVAGRWIADADGGEPVPAEFQGLLIDFDADGESCSVSGGGGKYESRWGAAPYGFGNAGWVVLYDPHAREMVKFKIHRPTGGRLVLYDPQTGRQVRMRLDDRRRGR